MAIDPKVALRFSQDPSMAARLAFVDYAIDYGTEEEVSQAIREASLAFLANWSIQHLQPDQRQEFFLGDTRVMLHKSEEGDRVSVGIGNPSSHRNPGIPFFFRIPPGGTAVNPLHVRQQLDQVRQATNTRRELMAEHAQDAEREDLPEEQRQTSQNFVTYWNRQLASNDDVMDRLALPIYQENIPELPNQEEADTDES